MRGVFAWLVLVGCSPPEGELVVQDGGAVVGDGDGGDVEPTEDDGGADTGSGTDGGATDGGATDGGADDTGVVDVDYPLCINEFMPDNASSLSAGSDTPDWIELYNPSETVVSLEGWSISDDRDEPRRHLFSDGMEVKAQSYLLLYADGLPEAGARHLSFSLDKAGGDVALFEPDGDGQVVAYGSVEQDFSLARLPDCCTGSGCIGFVFRGTPGATNGDIDR